MLDPALPFHNLHPNSNERTPWHVAYMDTESHWRSEGPDQLHTLRLWYGVQVRRHTGKGWPESRSDGWGDTAAGMVEWLEQTVTTKRPLWVYFHGLNFDLGLTKLPLLLMERGWRLGRHALAGDTPWANLLNGKRSIWLVDSFSWFRRSLEEVGRQLEIAKAPLPPEDGSEEAWYGRVRADVEILEAAMGQLMDWWDRERLGHWSHTGPACGWNAMRHMCVTPPGHNRRPALDVIDDGTFDLQSGKVTICTDPAVRAFEREAIYGGMREVSYQGPLQEGAWANLDLKQAHLRIAGHRMLPCKLLDSGDELPVNSSLIGARLSGIIARVRVRASEPSWPLRAGGRISHPTGEFWTTLCDPELVEARERGELLEVGRWHRYRLNHFMWPWARWMEQCLADESGDTPPAAWFACKAWSRTVIGKWATRTSSWTPIGTSLESAWSVAPAIAGAPAGTADLVQLGTTLYDVLRDQESDDAFPAILAWVQSWARRELRAVVREVGREHVVQVNTDGLLVNAQAAGMAPGGVGEDGGPESATWAAVAAAAASVGDALGLGRIACKGLYRSGWVLSPQHLQLDGWQALSGVPRKAERVSGWRFRFLSWPTLGGQMRRGLEAGYRRRLVERDLSHLTVPGWVMADGCVLPPVAWTGEGGEVRLHPPWELRCRHGAQARPEQAPWMVKLAADSSPPAVATG